MDFVTVVFADLNGSMELLADRDPESARQPIDAVLERLIAAVYLVGERSIAPAYNLVSSTGNPSQWRPTSS